MEKIVCGIEECPFNEERECVLDDNQFEIMQVIAKLLGLEHPHCNMAAVSNYSFTRIIEIEKKIKKILRDLIDLLE